MLDGACRIDRLTDRAVELGMTALALTDHGNLYGAIEFYNATKAKLEQQLSSLNMKKSEAEDVLKTQKS